MTKVVLFFCLLVLAFIQTVVAKSASQGQALPDPTRPVKMKNGQGADDAAGYVDGFPDISVSAVFLQEDSKRAVINGEMLVEGQIFRGLTLLSIHSNGVILANAESQKEFLINNNNFVKDTSDEF